MLSSCSSFLHGSAFTQRLTLLFCFTSAALLIPLHAFLCLLWPIHSREQINRLMLLFLNVFSCSIVLVSFPVAVMQHSVKIIPKEKGFIWITVPGSRLQLWGSQEWRPRISTCILVLSFLPLLSCSSEFPS